MGFAKNAVELNSKGAFIMGNDAVSETERCRKKGNKFARALWLVTGLVCGG